jgi:hypothetical protein
MNIITLIHLKIMPQTGISKYDFGGLERHPANILRLISELEGSYQLCKYMGFEDDMNTLDEIKKPYYKMYFKLKKEGN